MAKQVGMWVRLSITTGVSPLFSKRYKANRPRYRRNPGLLLRPTKALKQVLLNALTTHWPYPTPLLNKATVVPSQATPDTHLPDILEQYLSHPWPRISPDSPFSGSVIDPDTGQAMEYRELITDPRTRDVWLRSSANEFGCLAQGVGNRVKGTNTIFFITHATKCPKTAPLPTHNLCVNCNRRRKKLSVHASQSVEI